MMISGAPISGAVISGQSSVSVIPELPETEVGGGFIGTKRKISFKLPKRHWEPDEPEQNAKVIEKQLLNKPIPVVNSPVVIDPEETEAFEALVEMIRHGLIR